MISEKGKHEQRILSQKRSAEKMEKSMSIMEYDKLHQGPRFGGKRSRSRDDHDRNTR